MPASHVFAFSFVAVRWQLVLSLSCRCFCLCGSKMPASPVFAFFREGSQCARTALQCSGRHARLRSFFLSFLSSPGAFTRLPFDLRAGGFHPAAVRLRTGGFHPATFMSSSRTMTVCHRTGLVSSWWLPPGRHQWLNCSPTILWDLLVHARAPGTDLLAWKK